MIHEALQREVGATLTLLKKKHPDLEKSLDKAAGYAVFPSVGQASAVVGAAHGRGEVFEHGRPVGFATMSELTVGIQLGGHTFSEVVIFNSEGALNRFKRGRVAFAANASATFVKVGAAATKDFERDVVTRAFSRGGMMLELALGGQRFSFRAPPSEGLMEWLPDGEVKAERKSEPSVEEPEEHEEHEAADEQEEEHAAAEGEPQEEMHAEEAEEGEGEELRADEADFDEAESDEAASDEDEDAAERIEARKPETRKAESKKPEAKKVEAKKPTEKGAVARARDVFTETPSKVGRELFRVARKATGKDKEKGEKQ